MAVLAVGLRPGPGFPAWARRLGLELNSHGFIQDSPWLSEATTGRGSLFAGRPGNLWISPKRLPVPAPGRGRVPIAHHRSAPLAAADEAAGAGGRGRGHARVGVFLCRCGTNIAKTIDVAELAARVRRLPGVAHVEDQLFACSVESTRRLAANIRGLGLNRVVVAACTPRTHEGVFREVLAAAGLNPGFLAFANIREQCAWVHQTDQAAAREKALRLVAMAVRRAWVLQPIQLQTFAVVPRALVLGGGVAGMSATLSLADQGFHTYLVEREPSLGGLARQLYFTLKGLDPQEFLHELQAAVYQHPNIEVQTRTELVQLKGHVGQFQSLVRQESQAGTASGS